MLAIVPEYTQEQMMLKHCLQSDAPTIPKKLLPLLAGYNRKYCFRLGGLLTDTMLFKCTYLLIKQWSFNLYNGPYNSFRTFTHNQMNLISDELDKTYGVVGLCLKRSRST